MTSRAASRFLRVSSVVGIFEGGYFSGFSSS